MRINLAFLLCVFVVLAGNAHAAFDSAKGATQKDLRIIRVMPSGDDVAAERQIVITFNRDVVPLGKMERSKDEIPVEITPAVECEWRWLNTTSLACQLGEKSALVDATKYSITISPGITAEDGATIAQAYKAIFITKRPDVSYASFVTWRSAGTPVIRLSFDQPVTKNSVEKSITAMHSGNTVVRLDVKADPNDTTEAIRKGSSDARSVWLVQPKKELPLDSNVRLRLEPGLVSAFGDEPSATTRDVVAFDTYPELALLGVRCRTNADEDVLITTQDNKDKLCNPMAAISLSFSAPVKRSQVRDNVIITPTLGKASAQADVWGDLSYEYSYLSNAHTKGRTYDVNLPFGLKADQQYSVTVKSRLPAFLTKVAQWLGLSLTKLEDEFARKLSAPITLEFKTDNRKPNFVLDHHDAVLESQIDSDVPLYINNLEKTDFAYRSVTASGAKAGQKRTQDYPAVKNLQYAVPMGVREMLGGKSGALYGNLATTPDVSKWEGEHRLFAVVTPYQMHVKLGHFSSIVWVTDMASGEAVANAKVVVYRDALTTMGKPADILARAVTNDSGIAVLPGTQELDPALDFNRGWKDEDTKLFIRVDKGEDMAVMPLSYSFMIDTWRASDENIYAVNKKKFGHINAWGTTAQGIYRAGDTIQYKFYVRNQDDRTLTPAPAKGYVLEIIDPTDNVVETVKDISLNAFGAYAGEFKVAKEAAVGWYRFRLKASFAGKGSNDEDEEYDGYQKEGTWYPIRVLVSDFTPVPFKVTSELNGDLFHADQSVEVQSAAQLHSGGPYTDASVRVTAILTERPFAPKNPQAAKFTYTLPDYESSGSRQIFQNVSPLDNKGEGTATFAIENPGFAYGRMTVESAVQDDRGKYIASESSAEYIGVDRFVGMRSPNWAYDAKKPVHLEYIVVDERGNPAAGSKASVTIERMETTAARVKGAGNAYLTNYTSEWKTAGACEGVSTQAAMPCTFTPDQAGSYRAIAQLQDSKGRTHSAGVEFWVTGSDYVVWDNASDVLLPIIPEQAEYRVGDTARYLVKNPYPGATALITVERYGVIDSFVQKLEGSTPTIELEVKPDYLPGFYLSVLLVSPRVEKPLGEGQVDLGKPTFRMGYVTVPVKDKYKEMTVTATPAQDVYRPRDTVNVKLNAKPFAKAKAEPIELAVAVLDESVFDLVTGGEAHFDPYNGFYTLDGLDLRNYSLLTRLIGRQKFEKKGANQGGDGGADLKMRDQFKFVAYWNPSLKTDANGNADISFAAPDNLTGWRVLALAVTPTDRLGLGQANFKVNRPTEVRPVMPNQVAERDSFSAGFSVMNRTDKARTLDVTITASGLIDTAKTPATHKQSVMLEPYKRTTVYMPIQVASIPETRDVAQGEIRFDVRASDDADADGMAHSVPVNKMRSLETAATYGTTTEGKITQSIQFPDNIYPDVGSVSVVLAPSVIGAVEGAFKYMKNYPYICWEQILTKGVMASHYQNLKSYMPDSFEWKGSDALAQETLAVAANFQTPSGGMAYFRAMDEYADPYLSAYTAMAFNWLRAAGHKIPENVESKLHSYLLNMLRNDALPGFYDAGMSATVRAVALAALAEHGKINKDDLQRYQKHVAQMSLFGKTHFMQAALKVDGADDMARPVADLILSASNQTGGKFIFNETLDDSYARILASPLRENCAILDTFVQYGQTKEGAELVGDIPFKLVRTITQTRGNRDHWENTQENMFCMNALINYSRVYEAVRPDMKVSASLNDIAFGQASFDDVRNPPAVLERKIEASDVGSKVTLSIDKRGDGRLYYASRLRYAPKADFSKPVNAGIELKREYSLERGGKWQLLTGKEAIKRGDLVRVDLYLSLPAARNFVAVNDPVPGGLEPVNRDLANTSKIDADKGNFTAADGSWFFRFGDWQSYNVSRWSFYHKELRHDSVRFYSDYLPPGNYHLSYTAQAIADGKFTVMPTLAEEMYDPDVYGKDVMRELDVQTP